LLRRLLPRIQQILDPVQSALKRNRQAGISSRSAAQQKGNDQTQSFLIERRTWRHETANPHTRRRIDIRTTSEGSEKWPREFEIHANERERYTSKYARNYSEVTSEEKREGGTLPTSIFQISKPPNVRWYRALDGGGNTLKRANGRQSFSPQKTTSHILQGSTIGSSKERSVKRICARWPRKYE